MRPQFRRAALDVYIMSDRLGVLEGTSPFAETGPVLGVQLGSAPIWVCRGNFPLAMLLRREEAEFRILATRFV
jgi:hypothetical protein